MVPRNGNALEPCMTRIAFPAAAIALAALVAPAPLAALDRIVALSAIPQGPAAAADPPANYLVLRQADAADRLDVGLLVSTADGPFRATTYPGFLPANPAEPTELLAWGDEAIALRHHLLPGSGFVGHVEFVVVPEWMGDEAGGPPEPRLTVLALNLEARARDDVDRWGACQVDFELGTVEIAYRDGAEARRETAEAQIAADPPDLASLSADVRQGACAGLPF